MIKSKTYYYLFILIILLHTVFHFISYEGNNLRLNLDSISYLKYAKVVHEGSLRSPQLKRTPVYPILLNTFYSISGESPAWLLALITFQHLLVISIVLLVFLCAKNMGITSKIIFIGVSIQLLNYKPICYANLVMTEVLYMFFILCYVYFLSNVAYRKTSKKKVISSLIISGVLLSLATLTRPISQLMYVVGVIAIIVGSAERRIITFNRAIIFLVSSLLLIILYMGYNKKTQGSFCITGFKGSNFYFTVVDDDRIEPPDAHYSNIIRGVTGWDMLVRENRSYMNVEEALAVKGYNVKEIDTIMTNAGLEGVKSHPIRFVYISAMKIGIYFLKFGGATFRYYVPGQSMPNVLTVFKKIIKSYTRIELPVSSIPMPLSTDTSDNISSNIHLILLIILGIFLRGILSWGYIGIFIFTIFRRLKEYKKYWFILYIHTIIWYHALLCSAVNEPLSRYRMVIEPLMVLIIIFELEDYGVKNGREGALI